MGKKQFAMDHHPARWGQPLAPKHTHATGGVTRHDGPVVSGTSVLALRCADGILVAADTLASYGSLARFRDESRLAALGPATLLGSSGDVADFQATVRALEALRRAEALHADGHGLDARHWLTLLASHMYARRSKMEPLWNAHVVAGYSSDGTPVLGAVDLRGTAWEAPAIATGYGAYIALPLLRDALESRPGNDLPSVAEGRALLERCMAVLWYRDARATDVVQLALVTPTHVAIEPPRRVSQSWDVASFSFPRADE